MKGETLLSIFGLLFISVLLTLRIKGAILLGILATSLISIQFGIAEFPERIVKFPAFHQTFLKLDILGALRLGLLEIIFVFLFVDLFDTAGTLIGVSSQAGFLRDGKLPRGNRAFLSDAGGTIIGALLGTSTITSYIESAAGVSEGGRSGLTSVVVAALFLCSIFLSPIAKMIPSVATAPALIIVGFLMVGGITKIDWREPSEAIPAFITLLTIPLTYSIANGLALGFISYPIIKFFSGKGAKVHPLVYILAALFILRYVFLSF
jgi:AGZA family xanthine/uracil permease-like MFS transporter